MPAFKLNLIALVLVQPSSYLLLIESNDSPIVDGRIGNKMRIIEIFHHLGVKGGRPPKEVTERFYYTNYGVPSNFHSVEPV